MKFINKNIIIKTVHCKDLAISIRQEMPEDYDEVYKLVKVSFATENHAEEPDYLNNVRTRDTFIPELSLVAQLDSGQIVGQITLYETSISYGDKKITQLVLSPICVLPDYFHRGIASAMIKEGLIIAKKLGYGAVFLWGKPSFYSQFGFVPTYRYNIRHIQFGEENVDFIMVKELRDEALHSIEGTINID